MGGGEEEKNLSSKGFFLFHNSNSLIAKVEGLSDQEHSEITEEAVFP